MNNPDLTARTPIVLDADQGRSYPCGKMRALFKADGAETNNAYSISEWTLDPGCDGPGAHTPTANDDINYVLDGSVTFLLDGDDIIADAGAFIRVPVGVEHNYRNDTTLPARLLNIYIPGGFEAEMEPIVAWFAANPG